MTVLYLFAICLTVSGFFGKVESPILVWFLLVMNLSFFLQFGISQIGLFLGVDPLFSYLMEFENPTQKVVCYVIRLVIFSHTVYAEWQLFAGFLMLTAIALWIIRKASSQLRNWKRRAKVRGIWKFRKYDVADLSASQALQIHQEINILVQIASDAYYIILPFLLFLGLTILVVCNYSTIQFHHQIPFLVYCSMPAMSLLGTGIFLCFYGPAALVHEDSKEVLRYFNTIKKGKGWSKTVKSVRSIRYGFASMFYASIETEVMFYWKVVDFTITSLLISR
jgi:phosphate starvation-inducible membrane PsiE